MPRLQIAPLDRYPFRTTQTVRVTDLNYGGHLGNDRLLALLHEARVAFLAAEGWSELDLGGVALIMGDAGIVYRGEAFAGDELAIEVGIAEIGRAGFRLSYRVTRPRDGAVVALAETGMVCFDYDSRGVRALPRAVERRLRELSR